MSNPEATPAPNWPLLAFLGAVAEAEARGVPVARLAGLDPAELHLATGVAAERGLIDHRPADPARLALTPAGRAWAAEQLRPLRALTAAAQAGAAA